MQLRSVNKVSIHFLWLITRCVAFMLISCSKGDGDHANNNLFNALIIQSSGDSIQINASNTKAVMYYGNNGSDVYLKGSGNNVSDASVQLLVNTGSNPNNGTYPFQCSYITAGGATYLNTAVANPGSITFTRIDDYNLEGYFNAVCKLNADSVIITGSFKGDHLVP